MKIDKKNVNIINTKEVSMHDDIITNFTFDRVKKILELKLISELNNDEIYNVIFNNVLGFEITSCDYWGKSPHIFDFDFVFENEQTLIPKLFNKGKNVKYGLIDLKNINDYLECIITFTSGDTLTIACEYIDFMKDSNKL